MTARLGWKVLCAIVLTTNLLTAVADGTEPASNDAGEVDTTKELLSKLTIGMVADVIDERTIAVRDNSSGKILLRLGNVEKPAQGSLSDEDYQQKLNASKTALSQMVSKQMVWWKVARTESDGSESYSLADIWTIDGRHINGALHKKGHLVQASHYEEELARDILSAEAEQHKTKQYELLKEALAENERAKAQAAGAKVAEEQPPEPLGLSGWLAVLTVLLIVVGAWTNFGRGGKKKANPNRKRNIFQRCWARLKTA